VDPEGLARPWASSLLKSSGLASRLACLLNDPLTVVACQCGPRRGLKPASSRALAIRARDTPSRRRRCASARPSCSKGRCGTEEEDTGLTVDASATATQQDH
jgi:hypothetical protein